ncbi:phosphoribosyltransferase family protein [Maribacter sp.]|nr:phosphoribosyltransferase family protein [Maribacter sp.]
MPLTEYTFNVENPLDRIFYGRIDVKKASSFLFFRENSNVQQLIHHLKYRNQPQIGVFLGDWYGQLLKTENSTITEIDFVVPVPLHRTKMRKRGYNQVSLFAKRLAYHLNAELVENVLKKTANTRTQTKKGRIGRWQANKALYILENSAKLQGKKILLVDDVITTGATMEICAQTLLQIPGINLYIASISVVPLT